MEPVQYEKNGITRLARTPAEQVRLSFEGWKTAGAAPTKTPLASGGNPADFTVAEVNAYLESVGDESDEYDRVLNAEAEGKARTGILGSS